MSNVNFKCEKCGSSNVEMTPANLKQGGLLGILDKLKIFANTKPLRGLVKVTCKKCGHTTFINIL